MIANPTNGRFVGMKLKMTQIYKGTEVVPVTPVQFEPVVELPFKEGDYVKVSGYTKGRGFQGVVTRHSFRGGPKTRGQKNRHRGPGSIGNTAPQRVLPGRRMAGHMGVERVTVENLEVAKIDAEKKIMFIKGAVAGHRGQRVEVRTELFKNQVIKTAAPIKK